MRRRKSHGGVSLFAFQDILFGTIGIILMMMILFILMIGAEISIDSPQSASTQEENRIGTDVLEDRVERLQAEKTYLEDLLNADYTRRSNNLALDIEKAIEHLENLRESIIESRTELEDLANATQLDGRALRALQLLKIRDELRLSMENADRNPRVTYQIAESNEKMPILIEFSNQGIIISRTSMSRGGPYKISAQDRDFAGLCKNIIRKLKARKDIQNRYLLYVIKPSGIRMYEYLSRLISQDPVLGKLSIGLDLLPEHQTTAPRLRRSENPMKRRAIADVDGALDTFVDTVCCLFGVIMLIALLFAVLVQFTTDEIIAEEQETDPRITEELVRLETRKGELENSIDIYSESDALSNLFELDEGDRDLTILQLEIGKREAILDSYQAALQSSSGEILSLIDSLEELEEEIKALENRVRANAQLQNRPMRTPQQTKVDTDPTTFALVNGKLYEINYWDMGPGRTLADNGKWCFRMKQWNTADVDVEKSSARGDCFGNSGLEFRSITLRPDGGIQIKLDETLEENQAFKDLLRRYNPRKQMMYIEVATNSFREFGLLRAALAKIGFRYQLNFQPENFKDTLHFAESWVTGKPDAQ